MFVVSKRSLRGVIYVTGVVTLLYVALNVAHTALNPRVTSRFAPTGRPALSASVSGIRDVAAESRHDAAHPPGVLLSLKDVQMRNDGTVDLKLNLNMLGMTKLLSALAEGSFVGEMTMNPLPVKVNFIIANSRVCQKVSELGLLIYIHSTIKNTSRRKVLRKTWARKELFKEDMTRVVFLMGRPKDDAEMAIIHEEDKAFGDLVVGDFIDHYRNLTLKAIMGLKWTSLYCANARYAIKADDDAFVNIFALLKVLKANGHRKKLIVCPLWKANTMPILRDPSKCMKWCVKFTEFPGKTHFPQYCAGLAFVISQEAIPLLYQQALTTPFFWIDDVYISGVVASKVSGLEYVDVLQNFTLKEKLASEQYLDKNKAQLTYYIVHVGTESTFYSMWNATLLRLDDVDLNSISNEVISEYPTLKSRRKLPR